MAPFSFLVEQSKVIPQRRSRYDRREMKPSYGLSSSSPPFSIDEGKKDFFSIGCSRRFFPLSPLLFLNSETEIRSEFQGSRPSFGASRKGEKIGGFS